MLALLRSKRGRKTADEDDTLLGHSGLLIVRPSGWRTRSHRTTLRKGGSPVQIAARNHGNSRRYLRPRP